MHSMDDASIVSAHKTIALRAGYDLGEKCGEGSYKICYRAVSAEGRTVAFKVLKNNAILERNLRELDAMRVCDHPNIARCLDSGADVLDNTRVEYVVEDFFTRGSLQDRLSQRKPRKCEVLALGERLIDAISYLRRKQLVHRDIKPVNIMFSASDEPVLTDLGIVRALGDTSLTDTARPFGLGTPTFMPPEQYYNQKPMIDWRADQFALGITLALFALSMHPFGEDIRSQVQAIANRNEPSTHFQDAAMQAGLSTIIRMVQPYPVQRYNDPNSLAEDWRQLTE